MIVMCALLVTMIKNLIILFVYLKCRTLALHQDQKKFVGYALLLCYQRQIAQLIDIKLRTRQRAVFIFIIVITAKRQWLFCQLFIKTHVFLTSPAAKLRKYTNIKYHQNITMKGSILYNVLLYYAEYVRRFYVVLISCYTQCSTWIRQERVIGTKIRSVLLPLHFTLLVKK